MSFELKESFVPYSFITSNSTSEEVVDRVAEATMNHTISFPGHVIMMGKLVQMSARVDVSGRKPHLFHSQSIEKTTEQRILINFYNCLADLMDLELQHKSWVSNY